MVSRFDRRFRGVNHPVTMKFPSSRSGVRIFLCAISITIWGLGRLSLCAEPAIEGEKAVFEVSDVVVNSAPPNFGENLMPYPWTHYGAEPFFNQWWSFPNLEPIRVRLKDRATGGGEDFLENQPMAGPKEWRAGAGWFDVFRDGFFDGGRVEIFRYQDGKCVKVRDATVKSFKASKDGENRITFTEAGPAVEKGDEYVMEVLRNSTPPGTTRTRQGAVNSHRGYIFSPVTGARLKQAGVTMEVDSTTAPPDGGKGSLKVNIPDGAQPVDIGYWLHSNGEADWPQFKTGKSYKATVWLKQDTMSSGNVKISAGKLGSAEFAVKGEWAPYSFDFEGAPPQGSERFEIVAMEPGTLWVDNVTIVEEGSPAGAFFPEIVDRLRRFHPGSLRIWAAHAHIPHYGRALDDAIGPISVAANEFTDSGADSPLGVTLHDELSLCKELGTTPWVVVSTMWFSEEYANLIEYLAGPPDSPYGKKRAALGQVRPWTEVFPTILLEIGNETWNAVFGPQIFAGRAADYGKWAERIFQTMKASPFYSQGKFEFVLNGFVHQTKRPYGFASTALENSPSADAADLAYYTGGWDGVGMPSADNPKESWLTILTYYDRILKEKAVDFVQANEEIGKERGRPIKSLVYEAGPGYTLPGPDKFDISEQREGKSLGHAVNSLEAFMQNIRLGFREQNFFLFRNAHYWASHSRTWDPHIAWLGLQLRNTQLKGDLITAVAAEVPTISFPETRRTLKHQAIDQTEERVWPAANNIPLISCYPFKDGNRYSYMIISKQFNKATPVTVKLPVAMKPEAKVYRIQNPDITAHNIDSKVVDIEESTITNFSQEYQIEVPPHSVLVVVGQAAN
jgi:hypothetical protein